MLPFLHSKEIKDLILKQIAAKLIVSYHFFIIQYPFSDTYFEVWSQHVVMMLSMTNQGVFSNKTRILVLRSSATLRTASLKIFCYPALELFHCLSQLFHCLPLWKPVMLHGKKLQNATNGLQCSIRRNICTLIHTTFVLSRNNGLRFVPLCRH